MRAARYNFSKEDSTNGGCVSKCDPYPNVIISITARGKKSTECCTQPRVYCVNLDRRGVSHSGAVFRVGARGDEVDPQRGVGNDFRLGKLIDRGIFLMDNHLSGPNI